MLWPTETYEWQRIKFNDSSFIQMEGCEIEWFYFPLFSCSFQICFHCMKTKFGLFYRGHSCEMCKQTFCTRCHTKVSNSLTVIKQQKLSSFNFNPISHERPLWPSPPESVQHFFSFGLHSTNFMNLFLSFDLCKLQVKNFQRFPLKFFLNQF